MTSVTLVCASCSAELIGTPKFCSECGASVKAAPSTAEYKQVTVLFADVVHSMDIAAAVGAERLREILAELFNRSSGVVKRYGGTVDKFTGDGIMAVFGAPVALEDHALRACLAALDIQREARTLATAVERDDAVALELRVGLNSGEVIAGEIGSGPSGYTAVGEQVGMAQRMESVAPSGGVMLSESTAHMVEDTAVLGEPESVRVKGSDSPVIARRLMAVAAEGRPARRLFTLVGRDWEISTIGGILDQALKGRGRIIGLVGPPGIGKSRMVAEIASLARERGAEVVTTYCESHTSEIPFHVGSRLLRNVFEIGNLDANVARARIRARMQDSDPQDVALLEDQLGILEPGVELPDIDPDARRRRVAALLNAAAVARTTPAVFVIEDAHWIDEVSEAMIVDFATVVPQTQSLVLVTYRPEYRGALDRLPGSHRIALDSLDDSEAAALATELMGTDPSITTLVRQVAERAAGNPFFVEEMVRDLSERGVVVGEPGAYACRLDSADVSVPASLRATIGARIDRLSGTAKRTLNAAAVIGLQFDTAMLASLVEDGGIPELIESELIDQVTFTTQSEYVFRHPLIRAVAYESQLKSTRSQLHRHLADAIRASGPEAVDANAALIAQHFEAAGDLSTAYVWHMRAAAFADSRDARAARASWQLARDVADKLPRDDPDRMSKRIAPRVQLCAATWRVFAKTAERDFDELNRLCTEAGDSMSKAIGMTGLAVALIFEDRFRDGARLGSELAALVESLGHPALSQLLLGAGNSMMQGGQVREALRIVEIAIDTGRDEQSLASFGVNSLTAVAIAIRGTCRYSLGISGWREDFDKAIAMANAVDATAYGACSMYKYVFAVHNGALLPDAVAERDTTNVLEFARRASEDFAFEAACLSRALVFIYRDGPQRAKGFELIDEYRDVGLRRRSSAKAVRFADTELAKEKARLGDLDGAIEQARTTVDYLFEMGDMMSRGPAATVLVESLLSRAAKGDVAEAQDAIERLAAVPVDPGFVLHELPLLRLRALLAWAHGDEVRYREFADRYRTMANDLGFEGHMAIAEAMT